MIENQSVKFIEQKELAIDLWGLIGKLWQRRRTVLKMCGISVIVSLIIAFSIPKEYSVTVILSPESGKSSTNNLTNMASMLGLGNMANATDEDALNITLFPNILSSNPFALELYAMSVRTSDEQTFFLSEYVESQDKPWWNSLIVFPGRVVNGVISLFSKEEPNNPQILNPFKLSKKETKALNAIKKSMTAMIDQKSGITTITVTLQDPVAAATVADSVITKLQDYITAYRTKKAIEDYTYLEKLYQERQREYYQAQQKYANYVDGNKSLYTNKSKVEGDRLLNEMNLAYQVYNQMATQLQVARAKIQEDKPVFAIVDPATVPIKPSAPRKFLIVIGFMCMAIVGACTWILFGEDYFEKLKETLKTNRG